MFQTFCLRRWRLFGVIFVTFVLLFSVWTPVAAFGPLSDDIRVNTYTPNGQGSPDLAMDADGNFIVVWVSTWGLTIDTGQDGSYSGIYAQRYNAAGVPQGAEFRVNTTTEGIQSASAVAMDADGDFVVVWLSDDGSFSGIYAQRYNAAGSPQGSEFRVNTPTLGQQVDPDVAMDADGNFVVVWEGQTQLNGNAQVYARRYNSVGEALGGDFQVNTTDSGTIGVPIALPIIAMNASGSFIVAWRRGTNTENLSDSYAQRFDSAGVPQGAEFQVNTYTLDDQIVSDVAIASNGDFVVVWNSEGQDTGTMGVYGQRFNMAGIPQGAEFKVNITTVGDQGGADVTMDSAGNFVVVWENELLSSTNCDTYARRYNAAGNSLSQEFSVFQTAECRHSSSSVVQPNGQVVFVGVTAMDVYLRFFGNALATPPAVTDEFLVNTYTTDNQYLSSVAINNSGNFVIAWQSDGQDGSGPGIYAQRYNALAQPQGSEFKVNTSTQFAQQYPAVAMDANGNFVVVWTTTGGNIGVFAQRYNSAGVPQGAEITVYGGTFPNIWTSVAMNGSGDFVVAWIARLGTNEYHVYAQRFNASGVPQGGVITVEGTAVPVNSIPTRITMDESGNFIVTWTTTLAVNDNDVYARRFNANGSAQGNEFRVNTNTTGFQGYSSVDTDGAGNFVVTWQGSDGDEFGQHAQRFNASGVAQGNEFQVNMNIDGTQGNGFITMDDNGNFVIVWEGGNSPAIDVYARPYSASGIPQSNEFLVNVNTADYQGFYPTVAMNNSGNYVVTYLSVVGGANGHDVYARLFGPPIVLNATITENEFYTAFEEERSAFPAIAQGIADFVPNGINMTVTLNTGETGRVNFAVENADGFVTIQIASITNLSGGAASQNYVDVVSRDLPSLITATLDNLVTARFGAGQNVESMNIDNSSMTLLLTGS